MRPVDVDGHVAGMDLSLDASAVRSETNQRDFVG
jgi:hypothetical protein